jgi:hypothetical protein
MNDPQNGPKPNDAGAVIDLLTAKSRRALRKDSPPSTGLNGKGLQGTTGPKARAGASAAPPARATAFKVARAIQLLVIIAGTLYLMRTCGYL